MIMIANCDLHKCLVFISCFLVSFIHGGLLFSIGTIFMDIMLTFNTSRAETAIIQSTAMTVMMGTGFISGLMIHKFGTLRCGIVGASLASIGLMACFLATSTVYMIISFGIIFAFGGPNCLYVVSITVICQTFTGKRKLLMMSLQATGTAIGGMMYPYVFAYLSDMYGFRGALLIIGGFSMNCIPGCLLWKQQIIKDGKQSNNSSDRLRQYQHDTNTRVTSQGEEITIETPEPVNRRNKSDIHVSYIDTFPVLYDNFMTRRVSVQEGDGTTNEGSQKFLDNLKVVMKTNGFVMFTIGLTAASPSMDVIFIFVTEVFIDKDLTMSDVTFGLFLMNIVNLFARLLPGAMMQSKRIPTLLCPLFASSIATLVQIGFALSNSRAFTLGILAAAGIPIGMFNVIMGVIVAKLVGVTKLPAALGIVYSAICVGNAIVGPISGYIRDVSGSYNIPFYSAAALTAFASIMFLIGLLTRKAKKNIRRRRSSLFYLTSM